MNTTRLKEQEKQAHQLKRKGNPRMIVQQSKPQLTRRNLKWKQIAKELNLTVNQLQRRRNYSGYEDPRRNKII